jgi:hypothetical protein
MRHVDCSLGTVCVYRTDNWNCLCVQGTTEKSYIRHYIHSLESTDVKVQNITCTTNCDHRIAATLYALEALFASGI